MRFPIETYNTCAIYRKGTEQEAEIFWPAGGAPEALCSLNGGIGHFLREGHSNPELNGNFPTLGHTIFKKMFLFPISSHDLVLTPKCIRVKSETLP